MGASAEKPAIKRPSPGGPSGPLSVHPLDCVFSAEDGWRFAPHPRTVSLVFVLFILRRCVTERGTLRRILCHLHSRVGEGRPLGTCFLDYPLTFSGEQVGARGLFRWGWGYALVCAAGPGGACNSSSRGPRRRHGVPRIVSLGCLSADLPPYAHSARNSAVLPAPPPPRAASVGQCGYLKDLSTDRRDPGIVEQTRLGLAQASPPG